MNDDDCNQIPRTTSPSSYINEQQLRSMFRIRLRHYILIRVRLCNTNNGNFLTKLLPEHFQLEFSSKSSISLSLNIFHVLNEYESYLRNTGPCLYISQISSRSRPIHRMSSTLHPIINYLKFLLSSYLPVYFPKISK